MRRIEFLLGELRYEHPQAVELGRRHETAKQPVEVLSMQYFALRHIAKFGMGSQEYGRRKLGEEAFRQVEIDVESFQPWKFFDLNLGKDHSTDRMLYMR